MKRLLLLGGGHVHLQVLQSLARQRLAHTDVVLVTPQPHLVYSGMVPGVVAGHYAADQGRIALAPLAAAAGVRLVRAAAVALDANARRVRLADGRSAAYDVLSIDTGSVQSRDRLPGAREHGLFVRPVEDFIEQHQLLVDWAGERTLDIAVVGGGAAGFELALALWQRLDGGSRFAHRSASEAGATGAWRRLQAAFGGSGGAAGFGNGGGSGRGIGSRRGTGSASASGSASGSGSGSGIGNGNGSGSGNGSGTESASGSRTGVGSAGSGNHSSGGDTATPPCGRPAAHPPRIALVTGGPPPLFGYPLPAVRRAQQVLAERGITVHAAAATRLEAGALMLAGGTRIACQVALIATGGEAPPWLGGSGLALCALGFVSTGPTLQSVSHADVFAAGDVASRADAPHPRSGVQAVRAGPVLAANLRRQLAGQPLLTHRPPTRTLNLMSCGDREAIAVWGPWSAHGRWAWWWKDRIDRAFIARHARPAASPAPPGPSSPPV